ncbi:MAG: hypothetical protein CH104c_0476 [Candidatus Woesebacteria bacterium]|nr:MAG: hypothetical protein CH104c_0476 [Candidatus Woesebacteria bacterium]
MKKAILILLTILTIAGITAKVTYDKNRTPAIQKSNETTQPTAEPTPTPLPDPRIEIVAGRLAEEGSPLTGKANVFVNCGSDNGIDPYLLVGITAIESSFGKNACGGNAWGWASCKVRHSSLEAGCQSVAEGIATAPAYSRYRQTGRIEDLANSYCPSNSGCQTQKWVAVVQGVITDLQDREFIRAMEDLTKYLPGDKGKEEIQNNLEELKKRLETASGTNKEVIEILIRANERALEKGGRQ